MGRVASRVTGVVRRIMHDKGFGFLQQEGHGGKDGEYFFHRSQTPDFDQLQEGSEVEFEASQGPKGARAENVRATA